MDRGRAADSSGGQSPYNRGGAAAPALPDTTWEVAPELSLAALDAAAPQLTRLQVQVLANRGISGPDAARAFLEQGWHGRPPRLLGLDVALQRLRQARRGAERVVIFGDYDTDGITSCAVMVLALRAMGMEPRAYLPSRDEDGRGLNEAAVRALAAEGTRLIVTTDCGTSNVAEVRLANELGMDVIVTDHHPPTGELAPALALINPRQPGCPSVEKHLAGVGVAFRLAEALLTEDGEEPRAAATEAVEALLDLVAVGTIGDIVPLTSENWALAGAGLRRLNDATVVPRLGLRALIEQAGLCPGAITERDISYAIAPRLNAAGRTGEPRVALDLLLAAEPAEAGRLAAHLQALNEVRQRQTEEVLAVARAQAQAQMAAGGDGPAVLVGRGEDWHLGILGLVASRLVEEYGRPALVISVHGAEARGSARGPEGFNLTEALAQRSELFRRFGGHAQAAGFTLATADVEVLIAHLRAGAEAKRAGRAQPARPTAASLVPGVSSDPGLLVDGSALDPAEAPPLIEPVAAADAPALRVDCRLPLRRVVPDTYRAVRELAPFGPGFPEPLFLAPRVRLVRCWRSGPEGRNLRLLLRDGREERVAIWSRRGDLLPAVRELHAVDVVYTLDAFVRPGTEPQYLMRVVALRPVRWSLLL